MIVPAEVVPSPQLIVAANALTGSTPLAWVKLATWKLVNVCALVRMGPETLIAGSANDVVALALLLAVLGSALLLVTEVESVALPSSIAWAVTEAVADPDAAIVPREKVMTPPDTLKVPWLELADWKFKRAGSVSVSVTSVASAGPALVTVML